MTLWFNSNHTGAHYQWRFHEDCVRQEWALYGFVAQLVERKVEALGVIGSNPVESTNYYGGLAQLGER